MNIARGESRVKGERYRMERTSHKSSHQNYLRISTVVITTDRVLRGATYKMRNINR